jgi:hypothetical protein
MEYEVLSLIWHSKDRQYYESGAVVSMDHLPQITVEDLVRRQILKPVKRKKPKAAAPSKEESKE